MFEFGASVWCVFVQCLFAFEFILEFEFEFRCLSSVFDFGLMFVGVRCLSLVLQFDVRLFGV